MAPAITSAAVGHLDRGQRRSASPCPPPARPAPALTESGALPAGLTFTDNGNGTATIAGTPAAGSGGSYPITITATNAAGGGDPDASR